ncbi:MAG TPA: RNA methyltransferase [Chryseosolibacter sp.]|nr:RNA methyltransferase [Chryseosolibacter sp.]
MLSKATIKFIKSLQVKKYRKEEQCFLVEGAKSVQELMASDFGVVTLVATTDFLAGAKVPPGAEVIEVSESALAGLGEFKTNRSALAVARMKANTPLCIAANEYGLVLDDIHDPGNLGTIIRTADWYGIRKVIASPETADFYNPKVISATMGSFTRVNIYSTELSGYLAEADLPVYGACLEGQNIHETRFGPGGLIVIGSESHGISPGVTPFIGVKITIPRFGGAESLNAGVATAVILDNLRRTVPYKP